MGSRFKQAFCLLLSGFSMSVVTVYIMNVYFYKNVLKSNRFDKTFQVLGNNAIQSTYKNPEHEDIELKELLKDQITISEKANSCKWPPVGLYGREVLNKTVIPYDDLARIYSFMKKGHHIPSCRPYQKVAIIVPYRNREQQLKIFFNNVLPRIYRQKQEFGIYLVEQADDHPFNRGMLSNIGYEHAMQEDMYSYDCIVIHDVDMLPEDDRNLYFCNDTVAYHLAGKMERKNYSMIYPGFFGGISSVSTEQYKKCNGFSNAFFGWGAEDDDFKRRLNNAGFHISRPLEKFSHCGDVEHIKAEPAKQRFKVYRKVGRTWKYEGLNSLQYQLIQKERKQLYVWIYVRTKYVIV
ncbi:beta-1,4-galactosyltransferase 5-like [Mytilus edulis]|uniref:beta-1,4-galactosyltransferase 5-like n=1 Tax=Mytilus edulis TaxID=6550 RepID=UPI0039EF0514